MSETQIHSNIFTHILIQIEIHSPKPENIEKLRWHSSFLKFIIFGTLCVEFHFKSLSPPIHLDLVDGPKYKVKTILDAKVVYNTLYYLVAMYKGKTIVDAKVVYNKL